MTEGVWTRFAHDPRREENAHLRASDRDRDVVNDVLGEALADGRITMAELDERATRVAEAKTLGELPELIADLVPATSRALSRVDRLADPAVRRAEAERRFRAERHNAMWSFLVPSLICIAIWAAAGFGFPWPLFVVLGTGGRAAYLLLNREDRISSIEQSLERKRERALRARERKEKEPKALPEPKPEQRS